MKNRAAVCDIIYPWAALLPGGKTTAVCMPTAEQTLANLVTALITVIGWLYIYYMVDTCPDVVTISDYCF